MEKVINRQNVLFNFNAVKLKAKNKKICVVVKADAYGHGINKIVNILKYKADFFAVTTFEEAIKAREITKKPILILNKVEKKEIFQLAKLNISLAVYNIADLNALIKTGEKIKIHIKINTGMNRLGIKTKNQFKKMLAKIKKNKQLKLEGIYTHLYNGKDKHSTTVQIKKFKRLLNISEYKNLIDKAIKHVHSTNSLLNHNYPTFDMARVGLAIYGYEGLKPALNIYAKIITKQKLKAGEAAGYGAVFKAKKQTVLAVLNIGYANGVLKNYLGFHVLINNRFARIVAICMNLTIVDITNFKNVKVGTKVAILDGNKITADDIANYTGTISYEVLSNFK